MRKLIGLGLAISVIVACAATAPSEPMLVAEDRGAPAEVELYPGDPDLGVPTGSDAAALTVFLPKQLRSLDDCPAQAPADPGAQIALGLTLPMLEQAVHGSFTAANTDQVAYVVHLNLCVPPPIAVAAPTRIYIIEDGRTVAEGDGAHINRVLDIDLDGSDELVVSSGTIGQGLLEERASILSTSGGKIRTMQDFGAVLTDDCGGRLPGAASKLTRIFATPGKGAVKFDKRPESMPCDVD